MEWKLFNPTILYIFCIYAIFCHTPIFDHCLSTVHFLEIILGLGFKLLVGSGGWRDNTEVSVCALHMVDLGSIPDLNPDSCASPFVLAVIA